MATTGDHSRIELKLPNDPRAVSAVAGAVEHMAQRAGFPATQQRDLALAAEEACYAVFRRLGDSEGTLTVVVEEYADRVEVVLEHRGEAPRAEGKCQELLARLDRVDCRTSGGLCRWVLVKFAPAPTAQA